MKALEIVELFVVFLFSLFYEAILSLNVILGVEVASIPAHVVTSCFLLYLSLLFSLIGLEGTVPYPPFYLCFKVSKYETTYLG